jgi:hypothetical protein
MDPGRGCPAQIPDRGQYVHSSHRNEVEEVGRSHKVPRKHTGHTDKTGTGRAEGEGEMIPIADMVDHVESLCRSHDIGLFWCRRSDRSYSIRASEEITIAPIKSVVTYAVALHEIGHIRGCHQDSRRCMVRERWAWDRAKRNVGTIDQV